MPIIRKVINLKSSRGITLPKSWIEYWERKAGSVVSEVELEVGDAIIITPVITKKKVQEAFANGR